MEKIVEQGLLYDFYGELLTDHQRSVYEDVVFNDLSPSEIAKEQGISRQGVHDLIRRCNKILEEYEAKLHLVAKFVKIRQMCIRDSGGRDPEPGGRIHGDEGSGADRADSQALRRDHQHPIGAWQEVSRWLLKV